MSRIRFFVYQFILFLALLVLNIYSDSYISKPFSIVDIIAICISFPIFVSIVILIGMLYKRFNARLRNKILLCGAAFILAIIVIATVENVWFEIKGEMLFK
ncbi:hypothetical protein AFL42_02620 [Oceanobacillus caeni]|uniref:Uncharacterized protein n=1 Tax=Oceanobacillus caeni TaxID=405946 RepID=A0ABR5MML3_9BACI|nr:hypothetical protein AFL42_02620 [Oceanobacillus caeni]